MSKFKIVGIIALIAFAVGILLVGNVVAAEKFKCRGVKYMTKSEITNVSDEKGHMLLLFENVGVHSNMQGKTFCDGWFDWDSGLLDINPKTGMTGNGYLILTDKDGDKIYMKWDMKPSGPNEWTFFKGTGKFEGIRGKGTHSPVPTADPKLSYVDWEGEVELPKR